MSNTVTTPSKDTEEVKNIPANNELFPAYTPELLQYIGQNFNDWFTAEDVYKKLGQLSEDEINKFCYRFTPTFFESVLNLSESKQTRFKKTFGLIY